MTARSRLHLREVKMSAPDQEPEFEDEDEYDPYEDYEDDDEDEWFPEDDEDDDEED